jgi:predicted nucleic acid-binding protein
MEKTQNENNQGFPAKNKRHAHRRTCLRWKPNEPFYEKSLEAFTLAVNGLIKGIVSAGTITDIYYIIRKSRQSKEQALKSVMTITNILNLADTTGLDIKTAIVSNFFDFEDAVLSATASREEADYIITRNSDDFAHSPVKALSPEEFVEIMQEHIDE